MSIYNFLIEAYSTHIINCNPFVFKNEITEKSIRTSVSIGRAAD